MYNGTPPLAGGIGTGVLATTGGDDIVLPLILAIAAVILGGLLIARERWLNRRTQAS